MSKHLQFFFTVLITAIAADRLENDYLPPASIGGFPDNQNPSFAQETSFNNGLRNSGGNSPQLSHNLHNLENQQSQSENSAYRGFVKENAEVQRAVNPNAANLQFPQKGTNFGNQRAETGNYEEHRSDQSFNTNNNHNYELSNRHEESLFNAQFTNQSPEARAQILRSNSENNGDGSYNFQFETENGITRQETGELKYAGGEEVNVVRGFYSYTGPDGVVYTVNYEADENGFRANGDHIAKIPDVIQRSLNDNLAGDEYSGEQSGFHVEERYQVNGREENQRRQEGYNNIEERRNGVESRRGYEENIKEGFQGATQLRQQNSEHSQHRSYNNQGINQQNQQENYLNKGSPIIDHQGLQKGFSDSDQYQQKSIIQFGRGSTKVLNGQEIVSGNQQSGYLEATQNNGFGTHNQGYLSHDSEKNLNNEESYIHDSAIVDSNNQDGTNQVFNNQNTFNQDSSNQNGFHQDSNNQNGFINQDSYNKFDSNNNFHDNNDHVSSDHQAPNEEVHHSGYPASSSDQHQQEVTFDQQFGQQDESHDDPESVVVEASPRSFRPPQVGQRQLFNEKTGYQY